MANLNTGGAAAIFIAANHILVELLLFSAFWFLVGAIDDLCVDVIWAVRRLYRRFRFYARRGPMRADDLPAADNPGMLAIFVPTWQEAPVIGAMLRNCQQVWGSGQQQYRIYVGCYKNDDATMAAVQQVAAGNAAIQLVQLPVNGPTSKADCLNYLWQALLSDEAGSQRAKAVILHDAEDLVHRHELRIYDRLIEKHPAVQIPVLPLPVPGSLFISGHYCDEFAEAHGKSLVVREALGASVPLAGVGCAIRRDILGKIAGASDGKPFDTDSLTEDYELGFKIGTYGQTILARFNDADGQLVASRAYFPADLVSAVRQKARWMTGIGLTGWDRLGWRGSLAQRWMLLRDRKALLAAIVLCAAYLCILLTGILTLAHLAGAYTPPALPPFLVTLLWVNFGFLVWRLFVRGVFAARLYGWRAGLMTVPRSFVANIIAIMAARRACAAYIRHLLGAPLRWDKTEHQHFPHTETTIRPKKYDA